MFPLTPDINPHGKVRSAFIFNHLIILNGKMKKYFLSDSDPLMNTIGHLTKVLQGVARSWRAAV